MWWRLALLGVTAGAVTAAVWADVRAPASRTVGVIPVPGQASLPRPDDTPPDRRRAWRMVLRLDPDLRQPGPEWTLREGKSPGLGYELAWLPAALGLQLTRGGDQPLLLGTIRLKRPPHEVVLSRRGAALSVSVDGRIVLDALDPEGIPEPPAMRPFPDGWAVLTPSSLGATTFAVHDEGDLPAAYASDLAPGDAVGLAAAIALGPADLAERKRYGSPELVVGTPGWRPTPQPGRPDHALLCVRQALSIKADRDPDAARAAIGQAARAVASLGTAHPQRARLSLWLAWAEARNALASVGPGGATQVQPALDQLAVLVTESGIPEGPGMLLALLPGLADRATRRPPAPRPLNLVLDERSAWLATLDSAARAALEALPPGAGSEFALELRFISHACGALGGTGVPQLPLPADAPEWLACRWRILAGGAAPESGLPLPPGSRVSANPALPVVEQLMRSVAFEPLSAVRLRAAIADRGGIQGEELQRRFDATGVREAAITRLAMALDNLTRIGRDATGRRVGTDERDAAVDVLRRAIDGLGDVANRGAAPAADSLVHRDPLAFALACLAESRLQRLDAGRQDDGLNRVPWQAPEPGSRNFVRLAPFAQLLSGEPAATDLIWLHDDAILPPAQALAAALAMREVREEERARLTGRDRRQGDPDWSLTRRLRSYTLPLEMLDDQFGTAETTATPTVPGIANP
jgi:hypothetical protein